MYTRVVDVGECYCFKGFLNLLPLGIKAKQASDLTVVAYINSVYKSNSRGNSPGTMKLVCFSVLLFVCNFLWGLGANFAYNHLMTLE